MRCFWCILLAFCILSCGGNSAGPEPELDPEPITDSACVLHQNKSQNQNQNPNIKN